MVAGAEPLLVDPDGADGKTEFRTKGRFELQPVLEFGGFWWLPSFSIPEFVRRQDGLEADGFFDVRAVEGRKVVAEFGAEPGLVASLEAAGDATGSGSEPGHPLVYGKREEEASVAGKFLAIGPGADSGTGDGGRVTRVFVADVLREKLGVVLKVGGNEVAIVLVGRPF